MVGGMATEREEREREREREREINATLLDQLGRCWNASMHVYKLDWRRCNRRRQKIPVWLQSAEYFRKNRQTPADMQLDDLRRGNKLLACRRFLHVAQEVGSSGRGCSASSSSSCCCCGGGGGSTDWYSMYCLLLQHCSCCCCRRRFCGSIDRCYCHPYYWYSPVILAAAIFWYLMWFWM